MNRADQLGLKTALIEKAKVGGTCAGARVSTGIEISPPVGIEISPPWVHEFTASVAWTSPALSACSWPPAHMRSLAEYRTVLQTSSSGV